MRETKPILLGVAAVAALLVTARCREPLAYRAPVSRFRDASAVVIESARAYLTALNKTERDTYIYRQLEFRRQIKRSELEQTQVFSDEGIAARVNALDRLSDYTELLCRLASDEPAASIRSKAEDLKTSLDNLSGQVSKLAGANDTGFKSAAGKAFPILGLLLEGFVNKKLEDAIREAIDKGTEPVNQLITAIELDMENEYERKRSAIGGALTAAILEYNREFEKGAAADPATLRAAAGQVSAAADQAEVLKTAQPGEGLRAMKKANDALAAFARKPKPSAADLAGFTDAMEAFANTARRVGDAVRKVREP